MNQSCVALSILLLLAACDEPDETPAAFSSRDSAGVQIIEYPGSAWAAAPEWKLSAQPVAVIGGDVEATDIDLTSTQAGLFASDGSLLISTAGPPQLYRFDSEGGLSGTIGRSGEGPGEYRFVAGLSRLGGDTITVYDMFTSKVLLFRSDGELLGTVQFPRSDGPIGSLLVGRLDDGTWISHSDMPVMQRPEGSPEIHRSRNPVLGWSASSEQQDTLAVLPGTTARWGMVKFGGESMEAPMPVGFGANSFLGVGGDLFWSTPGDRFVVQGRDASGGLVREIRLAVEDRPVTETDRKRLKEEMLRQFEAVGDRLPAGMIDIQTEMIDNMVFATHLPQVGGMNVDGVGRLWITTDHTEVDSLITWGVFSVEGELLGRVGLSEGVIFAASADRLVTRREDDETGLVILEIWAITPPGCDECGVLKE